MIGKHQIMKLLGICSITSFLALLAYWHIAISLIGISGSFLFLVLILRFGWNWALLGLVMLVIETSIAAYARIGELVAASWQEITLSFVLAALCGLLLPRQTGEEQDVIEEEHEEKEKMLHEFVEQRNKNKRLEMELLKAETLRKLDKILVQAEPEEMLNACMRFLWKELHIEQVGVYHLDSSKKAMRIKLRVGVKELVAQTVFIEEAPVFYNRLLEEEAIIVKKERDGLAAPILAAPIFIKGRIQQVLIVREIAAYLSAGYSIEFLHWIIGTLVQHYEQVLQRNAVSFRDDVYTNTRVYRMSSFRKWVSLEREREEMFEQPFTCIGMYVRGLNVYRLSQVSRLLVPYLREPDKLAYDEHTQMLYILLPGTEREAANLIRRRVEALLRDQQLAVINCTMLQNGIAI